MIGVDPASSPTGRRPHRSRLARAMVGGFMGAASIFAGTTNADQHWSMAPGVRVTLLVDLDTDAGADGKDLDIVMTRPADPPPRPPRPRRSRFDRWRRRLGR